MRTYHSLPRVHPESEAIPTSIIAALAMAMLWLSASARASSAQNQNNAAWPPVNPAELAMKDCAQDPGAPAMILDRQEVTADVSHTRDIYYRIKIFKEAGVHYGDVEIQYYPSEYDIGNIRGRTIHADGKILDFDGEVYDREVIKSGRFRVHVKAFALPDVEPGSVIEYAWRESVNWKFTNCLTSPGICFGLNRTYAIPSADWQIQRQLFTAHAKFIDRPLPGHALGWSRSPSNLFPNPQQMPDGGMALEIKDVQPIHEEELMPPTEDVTDRFHVYYFLGPAPDFDTFWREAAKAVADEKGKYVREDGDIKSEAARIVLSGDSDDTKARKIYARVLQIRNLSAELSKTQKEEKKEGLKENNSVSQVLKRGYARGNEIDDLYVALARAAGLDADIIETRDRRLGSFDTSALTPDQINAEIIRVQMGSGDIFLDPAAPFCPFGSVPWYEMDEKGMLISRKHPGLISIPDLPPSDATLRRTATLSLADNGDAAGVLQVTYSGEEAYLLRELENNKDETHRRKDAENEAKRWLPGGSSVHLKNHPVWDQATDTLDLTFDISIPSLALHEGRHVILPPEVLETNRGYPFQVMRRYNPIDFRYPYEMTDSIVIQLPAGLRVEALPGEHQLTRPFGSYDLVCTMEGNKIVVKRQSAMTQAQIPLQTYSDLHLFYDAMRAGDHQAVLLQEVQDAPH